MRSLPILKDRYRLPLGLVIQIGVIMYYLTICIPDANALTPQEIFRKVERQVVMVEILDENGTLLSSHTALMLDKEKAVTTCDVIEGASNYILRQGDKAYPAKPGKKDMARNLCIVDVAAFDPPSVITLREGNPAVGAQIYALSNALGMGISISEGVISGVRASRGDAFIQFTAAIAPGSEGGGLFDVDGHLVGLIDYRKRDGQNINFAYPAGWLKEIEQRSSTTNETESWRTKAQILERAAKWPELVTLASEWTQTLGDSTEGWLYLGYASEQIKDWPAMERAYREVLKRDSSTVQGGIGLAKSLLFQNKPQDALDAARGVLTHSQEDASAWLLIAIAQLNLNLLNDAKQSAERAIQLTPWHRDIYKVLMALARHRGDLAAAIAAQRQIIRIDQQSLNDWIVLSQLYLAAVRPERALSSAERAIEVAPASGDAWFIKGRSLHALNRYRESIEAFKKGIELNSLHPEWGWGWLGDVYADLQIYPEAINAYRKSSALDTNDVSVKGRLGIVLKDNLQTNEALSIFEKLRDDSPDNPLPWRQIGFIYGCLAQPEKAIPAYEKALSLDPKEPKVWMALMESYHSAGRYEDVKRAYPKLMAIDRSWGEQAYNRLLLPYGEVAP